MFKEFIRLYRNPQVLVVGMLSFFSGIPLLLTGSTLSFWLAQEGIDLATIGLLSLTALPYTFKFVWSPLVDRLPLPYLTKKFGQRRGWLLLSQIFIVIMLLAIARVDPQQDLDVLIPLCSILAFAAATQEIVALTYQVERLNTSSYGAGEAISIFGYRMGLILAGAGSFYFASFTTWSNVYRIMAALSALGIVFTLLVGETKFRKKTETEAREFKVYLSLLKNPRLRRWQAQTLGWLYGAVICPFAEFVSHKNWILSLAIIFLYKASDNLIGNMSTIFYSELGFSKIEIANAAKIFGMWASIAGGFIGGMMITRIGIIKSLFYGCLIHALAILAYLFLYYSGYNLSVLYLTIGIEHFTGGMRLTALFSYQMVLCSPSYAATQLALCASLVTLGRTLFAVISGFSVQFLGWVNFFSCAALLSIPSLLLIILLAHRQQEFIFKVKKIP